MKICVFYLVLLFPFAYQDSIPDMINAAIKEVREAIPEVVNISSVSPDFSDNKYLSGALNITDINAKGLKEFDVEITYSFLFSVPTHFVLTLNPISVDLDYLSDLVLLNMSLLRVFGEGKGSVVLTNFTAEANIALTLSPNRSLSINELKMHLDNGKLTIDGLLEDAIFSQLVSDFVSDNIASLFNEYEGELCNVLEDEINKLISDFLNKNSTLTDSDIEYNGYYNEEYSENSSSVEILLQSVLEMLIDSIFSLLTMYTEDTVIDTETNT